MGLEQNGTATKSGLFNESNLLVADRIVRDIKGHIFLKRNRPVAKVPCMVNPVLTG